MKVISMFSGAGGLDLGFSLAGHKIVWANEKDRYACETYRLNFGDSYLVQGDVLDIPDNNFPNFSLIL